MKIRGMSAEQVDHEVAHFAALMQKGMRTACDTAAKYAFAGHLVAAGDVPSAASEGELSTAVDGLSVITAQWGEFVTGSLMPELNVIATKAANAVAHPLGGMPAVKTEQFIAAMTNQVTAFGDDVWQAAKTSLIAGAQDGESIGELAARVENVANVKAKKAHVIAQTTVIAAINGGEWQQMMEAASAFDIAGVKEWEATEDSHTRPTHHAADGQRVPIDGHFTVGGALLMFPGDPEGPPQEIISCRCTTLYDLDVEDQITASQTSPGTLSAAAAATTDGQIWDPAIVAAVNAEFNAMHPRGKDGKFIKKGVGLKAGAFDALVHVKNGGLWNELTPDQQQSFVDTVEDLPASQWHNLKEEDQQHLVELANAALDDGLPGSAKAVNHLDDLGADTGYGTLDTGENLFDPNVPLPSAPSLTPTPPTVHAPMGPSIGAPLKITHGLIHAKHESGDIIAVSKNGNTRIVWDGAEYRVQTTDADGNWKTEAKVKKSKLYAYLGDKHSGAEWHSSTGKQEAPTTHAAPLDAAPPAAPVPHPVSGNVVHPGTLGTSAALVHVLSSKEDLYSTNGKYKLSSQAGGLWVGLSKKQNDGTWSAPVLAHKADLPPSAKWKNTPGPTLAGPIAEPTLEFDNEDKYKSMWDISQYGPSKMGEVNTLWEQYNKGMMTKEEAYQQLQLVKNGPDTSTLTTPSLPPLDDTTLKTGSKEEILNSLAVLYQHGKLNDAEIESLTKAINKGDLLTSKMVININKPSSFSTMTIPNTHTLKPGEQIHDWHDVDLNVPIGSVVAQFGAGEDGSVSIVKGNGGMYEASTFYDGKWTSDGKFTEAEVLDGSMGAYYASGVPSYQFWHAPGAPIMTSPTAPAATTPSTVTAADLTATQKFNFYKHFKAEKVSPAWSASKIYHSMHAAKAKMGGDPQIAGMSDAELLKALDAQEKALSGKTDAYSEKVKEWLKTPNGQKAFKTLNPAIAATPTPSVAKKSAPSFPAKKVSFAGKKMGKKVAAKKPGTVSSTAPTITAEEALGDSTVDALADTGKIYTAFKGSGYGKYLTDKPEDIYWNAVQQSKATAHTTPGSILAVIDSEGAKKFGVTNEHKFTSKVKDWLNTPSGKVKAKQIKDGMWSPATAMYTSSSSHSYAHPADTPIDEKVGPPLQQVEEFDPSKGYDWKKFASKDFPVITEAKAKQMTADWNADQGPMNDTQKAALRKYTGSSYDPMNDYLRGYTGASAQIAKDVANAQKGMKLSLEPIVLHRGNGWFPGWSSVAEVKSHEGEDFHQAAFFSASIGGKSAFSGAINFVIECPPGTPMAFVDTFSQHPSEEEMLLGANLNYRVVEVIEGNKAPDDSQHYSTQVTVRLRVIPPSANATDVDTTAA